MSLTVIFVEITNDVSFLLPIMTSIMVSKWCADYLTHSLYHALLELKCVPFLDIASSPHNLELFSVKDIMTTNVVTLNEVIKVSSLVHILYNYKHDGFPVIKNSNDINKNVFRGTILRNHLLIILKYGNKIPGLFHSNINDAINESNNISNYSNNWDPKISFEMLNNYNVNTNNNINNDDLLYDMLSHNNDYLCLTPYINTSAFVIQEQFSISRTFILFRTMGLRHLTVVNEYNEVTGIITRYDLMGFNIENGVDKANECNQRYSNIINNRDRNISVYDT